MDPLSQMIESVAALDEGFQEFETRVNGAVAAERQHREELERKVNLLRVTGGGNLAATAVPTHEIFLSQVKSRYPDRANAQMDAIEYQSYKQCFGRWLKKGERMLTPAEVKTLQVGVDPDGGYLSPSEYNQQIVQTSQLNAVVRQICRTIPIGASSVEFPANIALFGCGWVGEISARTPTTTPQIQKMEIFARELYAEPEATQKLLDDAVFDVEAFIAEQVGLAFAIKEDAAFISGDGILQPKGLLSGPTPVTTSDLASPARAFGTLQYVASGQAGAWPSTDALCYDFLAAITFACKPAYRRNARWLMPTSVLQRIAQMKSTTGFPLWQPSVVAGQPSMLLGYPVTESEQMPPVAANSFSIAFGDFNRGYWIVDRYGVRVLRDPFTNKPYVRFYTTKRMGGMLVDSLAIKLGKFSVS